MYRFDKTLLKCVGGYSASMFSSVYGNPVSLASQPKTFAT